MTSVRFLETFLSLVVQVTALVACTAWLARRPSLAVSRDRLWAGCHAAVLLLTLAAFFVPHVRLLHAYPGPAALAHAAWQWRTAAGTAVAAVWAVGAVAAAWSLAAGWRKAIQVLGRCTPAPQWLRALCGRPDLAVVVHADLLSPFCWQIQRPVIALPEPMLEFPHAELQAVIRHEVEHLRLGHPLHLFLQRLVEVIYWFHPAVWWASAAAVEQREYTCDAAAAGTREEAAVYLRSLLRIAERAAGAPEPSFLGLRFGGAEGLMQRRAAMIVGRLGSPAERTAVDGAMLALLAAAVAWAVWLPIDPSASQRSAWSPWPAWTARAMDAVGISVRDYEIDGHRLLWRERIEPATLEAR